MHPEDENENDGRIRLDKWLWAARFFKTRSLATEAIGGGKVVVNGERAKRAKPVKVGDEIRIQLGQFAHVVIVSALSDRRGPATVAHTLYEETEESRTARTRLAEQLRMAPAPLVYEEKGRPTKRDRREITRFRKGHQEER